MAHFVICSIFGHFFPLSLFIPFGISWKYWPPHAAWWDEHRSVSGTTVNAAGAVRLASYLLQMRVCRSSLVRSHREVAAICGGFLLVPASAGRCTGAGEKWVGNTAHPCPPRASEEKVAIQKLRLLLEVKWPLSALKWQFCPGEDHSIPALLYLLGLKLKRKWEAVFLSVQVFFSLLIQPEETSRHGSSVEHRILRKPREKHHGWSFSRQWSPRS